MQFRGMQSTTELYVGEHFSCSPTLAKDGYALTGSVELPFIIPPPITIIL